jgi:ferrochelatase
MKRCAVVLFNLGGPDSLQAVQPFLFNLFADPDIFRLPLARLTQRPFARAIARRRTHEAMKAYEAIGGKSPLLDNTRAQAEALQAQLGEAATVFVCMRYWHPFTAEVVAELKRGGFTRVVLLPLYPQYSRTTTGSSVNEFNRECRRQDYQPCAHLVREWYDDPDFIAGIVETVQREADSFPDPNPDTIEVLFSAHGLPRKFVERGDPYEQQVRITYEAARQQLGFPRTTLCYQSRVGPLEWLRPYTDEVIRAKAGEGRRQILVYPIAFVSDHSETLYELGITYAGLARDLGVTHYRVVPALNTHPRLIAALKRLALAGLQRA